MPWMVLGKSRKYGGSSLRCRTLRENAISELRDPCERERNGAKIQLWSRDLFRCRNGKRLQENSFLAQYTPLLRGLRANQKIS